METIRFIGHMILERVSKDGTILSRIEKHNLVVNTGLEQVAKLLNGVSTTVFRYITIGLDNTAPAEDQLDLVNSYMSALASCDYEATNKASWEHTFTFVSNVTIREAGVFTTGGGVMLDRLTFADQNCGSDIDLHIKITIEVARG
jgi:hypothetical protein